MPYHYATRQEVDYRLNEITKAAQQRNMVWLAQGHRRRKPIQRILQIIGWGFIHVGEKLSQQAEKPVTTQLPADVPC